MPRSHNRFRSWIYTLGTFVVAAYIVVMWHVASGMSEQRLCAGINITVHDTAKYKFVTWQELANELGTLPGIARKTPLSRINIDSLERALDAFDKIERVSVNVFSDGKIHIDVHPMKPEARIFASNGDSYYINRTGKHIVADARYHLDVPVVAGDFSPAYPATGILPVIDFINSDSLLNAFVSMIKVDANRDIILVPMVRGHVINIGDTLDLPDKLRRIKAMYSQVMTVRGWEFYDTISVKWRGQIVATRRDKTLQQPEMIVETTNSEDVDVQTMMSAPGVAPGQALPGIPAKGEKPIPAHKGKKPAVQAARTDSADMKKKI